MKYFNKSPSQLTDLLHLRDSEIRRLKNGGGWKSFIALANELEQERKLRFSYQESTLELQKELTRYRILVGDELPPDEVA